MQVLTRSTYSQILQAERHPRLAYRTLGWSHRERDLEFLGRAGVDRVFGEESYGLRGARMQWAVYRISVRVRYEVRNVISTSATGLEEEEEPERQFEEHSVIARA